MKERAKTQPAPKSKPVEAFFQLGCQEPKVVAKYTQPQAQGRRRSCTGSATDTVIEKRAVAASTHGSTRMTLPASKG